MSTITCGNQVTVAAALVAVAASLILGCNGKNAVTAPAITGKSVSDLLVKLSNLQPYSPESCEYNSERSTLSRGVPSPSDVRLELRGWVVLSDGGAKSLMSTYSWNVAKREELPRSLLSILPSGNVLVSEKFNETFGQNKTYVHGVAAVVESDISRRVYFVAADIDHPVE